MPSQAAFFIFVGIYKNYIADIQIVVSNFSVFFCGTFVISARQRKAGKQLKFLSGCNLPCDYTAQKVYNRYSNILF